MQQCVRVRVPSGAPRRSKLHIACSDFFQKSERTHSAAPPFQITTASLGCDLVLGANRKLVPRKCSRFPCWSKLYIACSDFFQKSERAHSAAPPFQPRFAPLDSRLVLDADLKTCASKAFTLSGSEKALRPSLP